MFTVTFWKDAAERAIRTSAQALLALWATDISGVLEVDWVQAASVAALAAITSMLMSIAATGVGNSQDASAIK
ncbi:holin [Agrobacterium cavarae]|uniref:holin n=1 Tax=Agrobacterium cavarae TaxID=2528239 RepID=UPI003CFDCFD8